MVGLLLNSYNRPAATTITTIASSLNSTLANSYPEERTLGKVEKGGETRSGTAQSTPAGCASCG